MWLQGRGYWFEQLLSVLIQKEWEVDMLHLLSDICFSFCVVLHEMYLCILMYDIQLCISALAVCVCSFGFIQLSVD